MSSVPAAIAVRWRARSTLDFQRVSSVSYTHLIHVLDDGLWPIDEEEGIWNWNHIPVPTDLCDLCADRVSRGREPSCVHHCLAQVMKFGPIDELMEDLDGKPKQVLFVPR